ncbi:LOW QUALITY PROTEIN: hypothetical protein PHMEG_0003810 [Phytophthora megakarya]|uniref:Uncharacterized protein n=1 Tax=Phytophthora megakarya TaxID=4795 RepID=A0A225WX54_9STRA|nr:LOW QUALITY PROTEIN: hypothetical protein PHMEG_0003810 [Phytophthora megakarya]
MERPLELNELHPEWNTEKADGFQARSPRRWIHDVCDPEAPPEDFPGRRKCLVCDLDVGDAKAIALGPRSIAPHVVVKVYEFLKTLLENNLIEHSEYQWAYQS